MATREEKRIARLQQNQVRQAERTLKTREHFIRQSIRHYGPYYLIFWASGLVFSFLLAYPLSEVVNYDFTRFFAGSTLTISITTITLALPTAMNIVLERYSRYQNRYIINMLVDRFPITLLTLSAFTSLIVSLSVASGFLGNYFSPHGNYTTAFALLIMIFWAGICIVYLFIVIEKMVYFIVNSPEAVLDKLEFGVYETADLSNKEQYADFRNKLASINDIAATLVKQSTGRDVVIIRCLDALRTIHRLYLVKGIPETNTQKRKLSFKAVHATNQELIRIYREAANAKNENATLSVVNTWCLMVRDAVNAGADNLYLAEMLTTMERFRSYAEMSFVEVIEEQVISDWFFLLSAQLQNLSGKSMTYTRMAMIRELSSGLRRITVNNKENLFLHFARVASNSDLDINLDGLDRIWRGLLDRAVLVYLTWLLTGQPRDCEIYLGYLRTYSAKNSNWMRSILCDREERLVELLRITELADKMETARTGDAGHETELSAMEMEEEIQRSAMQVPASHAVSIVDEAEDMNISQGSTSVVTRLVQDTGIKSSGELLDDTTRKQIQTQTSFITEDDPRVLGGTAAIMGLPHLEDGNYMVDGAVVAFLVIFSYVDADYQQLAEEFPTVRRVFNNANRLKNDAARNQGVVRTIELGQRCANHDLFAVVPPSFVTHTEESS